MLFEKAVNFNQPEASLQFLSRLPILSSENMGWNGFHLEYHHQPFIRYSIKESFAQHVIGFRQGSPAKQQILLDGHYQHELIVSGDTVLVPSNVEHWSQCDSESEFMIFSIEPELFGRIAYETIDPDYVDLIPHFAKPDALMYQIALALKAEMEFGSGNSFYAESLVTTLSAHLLRHYCTKKHLLKDYTDGLPKYKLRQIIEYIHANIDREICLAELAELVQMSPFYFSRLFKRSAGVTPHKYITNCRIEKAKHLLAKSDLSIAEVSQEVGFESQSHFTRIFRQLLGVTPKVYRDKF